MKSKHRIRINAGDWFRFGSGDRLTCCDCGLVHVYEVAIVTENGKSRVEMRCWRDNRSTAATRHARQIKAEDVK